MQTKIMFSLALTLSFVGCAHKTTPILPGEWKVGEGKLSTGMPNYPLSAEAFASAQKKEALRAPATAMSDEALAQELEKNEQKPSLRRLYFRALYQQWREISQMSGADNELRSCPQYHHDQVVINEVQLGVKPHLVGSKPSANHLPFYPEWALNVRTEAGMVPVWKVGKQRQATEATKSHAQKLRRELKTLCEEGTSDSYFRLENIVTYATAKAEYQQAEGMRALLKIPVFSTMLLMKSIQGHSQAQFNSYDQELLNEVQAFQLQNYIVELKSRRQQLVTGSL